MKVSLFIILTIITSVCYKEVKCFNILAVFPYEGETHFLVFTHYLQELARRGHNVTVISPFPRKTPMENYHDIQLYHDKRKKESGLSFPMFEPTYILRLNVFKLVLTIGYDNCKELLESKHVQDLWKSQTKFDVVVVEQFNTDCPLGLAYKIGAPVVGISTTSLMPHHYDRFGIPQNPSYTSFLGLEGGTYPNILQRFERIFFKIMTPFVRFISQKFDEYTLAQYFDDLPPLEELARNIKILLLYQYTVLSGSSLLPANVIEVGGFHVTNPKPLPEELRKFIEESEHGVIYVSFGTNLNTNTLPAKTLESIISVLSSLPQRIIWKWNGDIPTKDSDFYFAKWIPQNDLLAHPNVVAFFSHCGNLGITEAIHHGVPVLGMPFIADQPSVAAAVEKSGLGVQIQMSEVTKDKLLNKFSIILQPNFRENVKILSKSWHDRPISPMDNAIFWTEFAANYPNVTLRSRSADVPFYEYLCLDILAIMVLIIYNSFYLVNFLLVFLFTKKQKLH
ncbi:UDP-glycosyltransferase UGT5-like [Epargyreus clarus]|uniref:UDP-glycosyltransferase UGT5-like n=1 Tax=Epargyreus clarus TaxID=520877 RepID=UPI003C2C64C4